MSNLFPDNTSVASITEPATLGACAEASKADVPDAPPVGEAAAAAAAPAELTSAVVEYLGGMFQNCGLYSDDKRYNRSSGAVVTGPMIIFRINVCKTL